MSCKVRKSENGWSLLLSNGQVLSELAELCFVADLKHSLALFSGDAKSIQETMKSLISRAENLDAVEDFKKHLKVVQVGKDVDENEADYMLTNMRLPKRVLMRLSRA